MLLDAKPIPAVTAKSCHKPDEPANYRVYPPPECHSPAAVYGKTRVARSEATPTTRKSHPAKSLDPDDRANQPLIAIPTALMATAAVVSRSDERKSRDGTTLNGWLA